MTPLNAPDPTPIPQQPPRTVEGEMAFRHPVPCHTGTPCNAGVAGHRLAADRGRSCGSGERTGGASVQLVIGRASGGKSLGHATHRKYQSFQACFSSIGVVRGFDMEETIDQSNLFSWWYGRYRWRELLVYCTRRQNSQCVERV